jgi:hypothetical protein
MLAFSRGFSREFRTGLIAELIRGFNWELSIGFSAEFMLGFNAEFVLGSFAAKKAADLRDVCCAVASSKSTYSSLLLSLPNVK